jgi:hypothetical protein
MTATARRGRALPIANVVFLATMVVHAIDHIRQGIGRLAPEIVGGGTVLLVVAVATLPLTLSRHGRAPLAAAAVGLGTAVAVAASHLAPHWSAFSDPYPDLALDAWSWAAMLSEIAAALVFGVLGVAALLRPAGEPLTTR